MIEPSQCWVKDRCKKASSCDGNFCIKLFKLNELCNLAMLTSDQRHKLNLWVDPDGKDLAAFKYLKGVEDKVESFVSNGENLYIYSYITGNGKTAWALRILNSYLEHIWYKSDLVCKALFVHVPRFLISLKDNISNYNDYYNQIKDNILSADLVVFDEVGAKVATTFETEHLLSIINARVDAKKSNIYTSNLGPEDLRKAVGDRMFSRIVNCSTNVQLWGSDKRSIR